MRWTNTHICYITIRMKKIIAQLHVYDWYESINIIYKKIDSYMLSHFKAKVQCDAAVIRELCESQDSCSDLLFSRKELEVFIEMLCIK